MQYHSSFPYHSMQFPVWMSLFIVFIVWTVFWKGLALWHAARRDQKGWFVALLILNTASLLPLIYVFGVAKVAVDDLFGEKKAVATRKTKKSKK